MEVGSLPRALINAYLATAYRVQVWDGFDLQIGRYSEQSEGLFNVTGRDTSAFLTAWNPLGEELGEAENRKRNEHLFDDVVALGLRAARGSGMGDGSSWSPEESLHVLGITFEQAVGLGKRYEQNAIVWVPEDFIPRLVLLV